MAKNTINSAVRRMDCGNIHPQLSSPVSDLFSSKRKSFKWTWINSTLTIGLIRFTFLWVTVQMSSFHSQKVKSIHTVALPTSLPPVSSTCAACSLVNKIFQVFQSSQVFQSKCLVSIHRRAVFPFTVLQCCSHLLLTAAPSVLSEPFRSPVKTALRKHVHFFPA